MERRRGRREKGETVRGRTLKNDRPVIAHLSVLYILFLKGRISPL